MMLYNHKRYKRAVHNKVFMITLHRSRQAGDTIVEVIIAVLVVSTLLTGAFVVTNRSTQSVRDSQEHAEALQALQGQLELLRGAADATPSALLASLTTPFCFNSNLQTFSGGSGSCAGAGGPAHYKLSIVCTTVLGTACPAVSGTTATFNLAATWPSISGNIDNVYLSYKVATP
jgi:Tfp pilus assembly protein PilV